MNHDYATLTELLLPLTRQAGEKILAVYHTDFAVQAKDDQSPLTLADQQAHEHIAAGLATLTPDIPLLSEESAALDWSQRQAWRTYWLVDPLDGTKEFVQRNGQFTVNIALIHDNRPVAGVVYAPVHGVTYYAAEGLGAYKQENGQAARAIRTRAPDGTLVLVGSRAHAGAAQEDLLACLTQSGVPFSLVAMGSSLKICLVAEGQADLYPRLGPTSEWDTAAAHCVLEQAGGQLTDLHLQPLRYNTKPELLNPWFLAFGHADARWTRCLAERAE